MTNRHHRASLVNKSAAKNRRDNERGKDLRPDREALIRNASLSNSPGQCGENSVSHAYSFSCLWGRKG